MELPEDVRSAWLAAGWKRGAFIRLDSNPHLREEFPQKLLNSIEGKDMVYVVPVLYDCALVEQSFDKEPWAQVLVIWESKFDGNFAFAKNPRKLHLEAITETREVCFEVSALSFTQIDREILLKATPEQSISWAQGNLTLLLDWVAERYRQATFPDSFNKRLIPSKKLLEGLWKSELFRAYSSGVYIKLDSFDELSDEAKYQVDIIIAIPFSISGREFRNVNEKYSLEMVTKVKAIFDAIKSIKVLEVQTISEREFTKELERDFNRFSLEYFSYRSDSEANPLPAEYIGA